MKIITLIENTSLEKTLEPEFGLSLLIQAHNMNILFDTGRTGKFINNAEKMGVDLKSVDAVVISHAHHDHTGGLGRFFEVNDKANVFIRERAFNPFYFKMFPHINRFIGMDRQVVSDHTGRFVTVSHMMELDKNIYFLTEMDDRFGMPADSRKYFTRLNGRVVRDDFEHELMLAIVEDGLLFGFTGCSHHGILNMIASLDTHLKNFDKIIIGGFHAVNMASRGLYEPRENVLDAGNQIAANRTIRKVLTGHCTGTTAYNLLKNILGNRMDYLSTGVIF